MDQSQRVLVLASNNQGKLREIGAILRTVDARVLPQGALGVGSCEEPYGTFLENALAKARHAAKSTGLPALADDSGICVEALGGLPGVHSARFAGEPSNDAANNRLLVQKLQGESNRRAHYLCVLAAVRSPEDPEPLVAEGVWSGEIVDTPRGTGGFGYDPHFLLPEQGKTAAELSPEEKNAVSHRAQALRILVEKLRIRWGWL